MTCNTVVAGLAPCYTFCYPAISLYPGILSKCTMCFSCCTMLSLWSQEESYCSTWTHTHGSSSAVPRVELVSCLVRQNNFVPSRRFREHGREASKLEMVGERGTKNALGALPPWRNKRSLVTLCRSKWSPRYLYPNK